MNCPKCKKNYFFLSKPGSDIATCRVCNFVGHADFPDYKGYHERLYLKNSWKRTCLSDPEMKKALTFLEPRKSDKVLEIGCGVGNYLFEIKKRTENLIGIDIEPEFARKRFNNINLMRADCNKKLPFQDNSFDKILCAHTIEHLKDPFNFLNEVRRILKNNGIFVVSTLDYKFWGHFFIQDPTHLWEWDYDSFYSLLKSYFKVEKLIKIGSHFSYYPLNFFLSLIASPDLLARLKNVKHAG